MPKRVAIVSLLLLAAVAAALLWSGRFAARAPARSAAVDERAAVPESSPPADGLAAPDAQSAGKLFGRVLEEGTDTPVAGAAVIAYAFATRETMRGMSAEDGTFGFPGAAEGQAFQLVVRHEASGSASLRVVVSDDPVVVRLSPGGGIRGRVVADENGATIQPCRVLAVRTQGRVGWSTGEWLLRKLLPEDLAIEAAATTGPDGVFEMAHVSPGAYMLLTSLEARPLRTSRAVHVEVGSTTEVEIREPSAARSLIDVIDEETGAPLEGARFDVTCEGITSPLPAEYHGGGVYELRRDRRRKGDFQSLLVRVSRSGYAPRLLILPGGRPKEHQRAALGHGATIAGHVRTSAGPLPRAFVFVVAWGDTLFATAITGGDGGFEIEGVDAPQDVDVFVLRPSLETIAEMRFPLRAGERRVLEIGGSEGAAIEGRVVLGGAPITDAWITLWGPFDSRTDTGADGAYAFEGLDPGRYDVMIRAEGQEFCRELEVGKAQRVRLDIDATCTLTGTVVDAATGTPVKVTDQILVRRVDIADRGYATAHAGDDGRFRLHVEPGVYEVDCPEGTEVRVVERPRVDLTRDTESGPVLLRVEPDPEDGRIVLDVKDARTGDTVPTGEYWQGRGQWWTVTGKEFTGERIEATGLSLDRHRFRVWSDAHAPTEVEIVLTPERKEVRQTVLLEPSEAIRVDHIERGAPEAIAGLREDDVIVSFPSVAALRSALASARGAVAIEVERAGERRTVTLPAGKIDAHLENILLGR